MILSIYEHEWLSTEHVINHLPVISRDMVWMWLGMAGGEGRGPILHVPPFNMAASSSPGNKNKSQNKTKQDQVSGYVSKTKKQREKKMNQIMYWKCVEIKFISGM